MTAATCPSCGAGVPDGVRFCESCGTPVAGAPAAPAAVALRPVEGNPLEAAPISAPTRRPADALPDPPQAMTRRPCAECGGEVGADLYCLSCGTKAPSERDHFEERPAPWVAGVCDRGIVHARNEDAMALLAAPEPGSRAVLVVLDGVSSSIDSDVASLAGAHAAREVLRMPLPAGMGTPQSRAAAVARVLGSAVEAANTAIVATTDPDSTNPASATFVAVVLESGTLYVANIGDSRAYWLPDAGEPVQLSVDDSVAEEQIASGIAREVAETSPQAHAITRWLGRDAPDLSPTLATVPVSGPGWVLVCSDGLWNYASAAGDIKTRVDEAVAAGSAEPLALATALVGFANGCGGHDNITVALARLEQRAGTASGVPTNEQTTTPTTSTGQQIRPDEEDQGEEVPSDG